MTSPATAPPLYAITVLGHDRPGIIAESTERLAVLGLNLEDCTMTLLRGHFAMIIGIPWWLPRGSKSRFAAY